MIQIDEIYVINVEDITAFEFVYKVDELNKITITHISQ